MRPNPRIYLAGLFATWNERDALYDRRDPLTRSERAAVIAGRKAEARLLDEPERGLALAVLREWRP